MSNNFIFFFNLKNSRNWLATAGARDHLIKVWNLNSPSGQSSVTCPSVLYTVRTSNVNRVRWRPTFVRMYFNSLMCNFKYLCLWVCYVVNRNPVIYIN